MASFCSAAVVTTWCIYSWYLRIPFIESVMVSGKFPLLDFELSMSCIYVEARSAISYIEMPPGLNAFSSCREDSIRSQYCLA